MKRQRRTLGLLLVWLAIALGAVRLPPQRAPIFELTAAPSANSKKAAERAPSARQALTGSLAGLVGDPRCASGAELVLYINAAEDGLSHRAGRIAATRRGEQPRASWLWPAWGAISAWRAIAAPGHGPADNGESNPWPDDAPRTCGARLAWSGCNAYRSDGDRLVQARWKPDRRTLSLQRWGRSIARFVRDTSADLAPWLNQLARCAGGDREPSIRITRRPGRAAPYGVGEPADLPAEPIPAIDGSL